MHCGLAWQAAQHSPRSEVENCRRIFTPTDQLGVAVTLQAGATVRLATNASMKAIAIHTSASPVVQPICREEKCTSSRSLRTAFAAFTDPCFHQEQRSWECNLLSQVGILPK